MSNFEKMRIGLFSMRRIVLSCVAVRRLVLSCSTLRRLVLMFNFEKICIELFGMR